VDGVFGSVTRGAIVAFQAAEGLPTDGFMSVAVAERLRRRVGAPSEGDLAYSEDTLAKVNSLADRYVAYLADLDAEESKRKEWAERLAKLREKQGIAERLAAQPVSAELRRFSAKFVGEAKKVSITTAPAVLDRLDDEFAKWQPQIDAGMALVQALTPANRFLFDGAPDDVVFLFNAAESSTVSRGLNGELVFERGGTPACLLHEAAADRFILRQIRGKAKSIRAELKWPFPRCSPETMESSDVLVLQRDLLKRQPAELVVSLANQVHAGRYASMALLTQAEVRAAAEAEARLLRSVMRNLETGDTSGFGIVVVENG
jgi:hypothetical protein